MRVLAIDPAVHHPAFALCVQGVLHKVAIEKFNPSIPIEENIRLQIHAAQLRTRVWGAHLVAIELPVIRPGSRVRAADILRLYGCAIANGAGIQAVSERLVRFVAPERWKGRVKKEIMTQRIIAALSPEEREIVSLLDCRASLLHNVYDAIGLAKWACRNVVEGDTWL